MSLCPVCGAAVEGEGRALEPSLERLQPEGSPLKALSTGGSEKSRTNGTAVLEGPPPEASAKPEPAPPEAAAVAEKADESPAAEHDPGMPLKLTFFPKIERTRHVVPRPAPPPEKAAASKSKPPAAADPGSLDASVVLKGDSADPKSLPSPARPLNAPWILGVMAMVTALLLPITVANESNRIMGIIGFCLSGFFLPFAPIAWIAGLSAEKRRREQRLRPEARVVVGRLLGQSGTLLLVAEMTVALILIAGLRLSGQFPSTFWTLPQTW